MDTTTKLLAAVGALLALVVGVSVYSAVTAAPAGSEGTYVVVARQDVPERTLFTAQTANELLMMRAVPADAAPSTALTQPSDAIGKTTTSRLVAREIVTTDRLVSPEGAGSRSSATIPKDKVALAITANDRVAVAGAVQPGDRVDVIVSWGGSGDEQPITQDLFQDVRVFGVGRAAGTAASSVLPAGLTAATPTTLTLLVDYQQAVLLEHVLRTGGSISLVLRRFDQFGDVPTQPITNPLARQLIEAGDVPSPAPSR